jgi:alpha-glucosidase
METVAENIQSTNGKKFPGVIHDYKREGNKFYFHSDNCLLNVWVVTDAIIRFRYAQEFYQKDFSYALKPNLKEQCRKLEFIEKDETFEVVTTEVICIINKKSLRIVVTDLQNNVITEDAIGYHWEPNPGFGGNYVYCSKKISPNECFFGLGDKPASLNLRGKRFLNWGTDTYGFAKEQDPLYRTIPFYYGMHNGTGYGIFFDNTFQSFFDFGKESPDVMSFWAEGGEMNYYFIAGPQLIEVAQNYAYLTGTAEMPPRWALGYQQSKWSYYPEEKVWELAHTFRNKAIPCDVIHLDIDYMDGFRCFTWDKTRFPDPAKMINELRKLGFKIITILDPGIKVDNKYWVFNEALENGYFCKRQDGDYMRGKVWPGDCFFPDFTNPEVRKWWGGLYKELIEQNVAGFWNDMNEPAVFETGTFPDDVRHDYDGQQVSHRKAHNVYGMQMARATHEGVKNLRKDLRPFVLTRSGYSGVQRYGAIWTGDNVASWEHLWVANMQCQRMSISGISFVGTDIGGFIGEPDGELFVRFIQMAIFHPFFRGHSSSDQGDKEPWAFGTAYEALIRRAIEMRYEFLPYIYSTFWQYVMKGTPMIKPLVFLSQNDPETWLREEEFGFGDQLLICPIKEQASTGRIVYLPKGNWYNYYTDKIYKGEHEVYTDAPLDRFPLYVKEGAVIPLQPVMQFTDEFPVRQITLHVYYAINRNISYFYEDEGDNYSYAQGNFSVRRYTVFGNRKQMRIVQELFGNYKSNYENFRIIIHGLPFKPSEFIIDGTPVKLPKRLRDKTLTITVNKSFNRIQVL